MRAGFSTIYPLSEDLILKVGASLLAGRYLSASSYLGELRLQHLERDFPIGPALARRFQKVDAALTRGQGPPRRAPEIKPSDLAFTAADEDGGPLVGSTRSLITATAWLLREAEVSDLDASARNIEFHADGSVTLRLPMSKQDQRGVGAARRLGCLCALGQFDEAPSLAACGACAVRIQLDKLADVFGASITDPVDAAWPLFPTVAGDRPLKAEMVAAWIHAAGGKPATGHTGRRSGAKSKTRGGWSLPRVQFFGRWAGPTVLSYVEEAVAEVTHKWSFDADSAASSTRAPQLALTDTLMGESLSFSARVDSTYDAVEALRARMATLEDSSLSMLESRISLLEAPPQAPDLLAVGEGKAHLMSACTQELPRFLWTSLCGWRFGNNAAVQLLPFNKLDATGKQLCGRCSARQAACYPTG